MEPSSFPKQYGGDLDWQWGDFPLLDDAALEVAPSLGTPLEEGIGPHMSARGPMQFQDGKLQLVGTENGKRRDRYLLVNLPPTSKTETTSATPAASTPLSLTETTNTETGEMENGRDHTAVPLDLSEKHIEIDICPQPIRAAAQPITEPLSTPHDQEKAVLETNMNGHAIAPASAA